ncbi:MAG: hypothetical protein F6K34_06925 [Okeania sp. SIO4D6]|nr:hypothetical protein [Okeania sp. SIO4D6]
MQQLSIYRRLQKIPFLRRLPDKIANNLVIQISSTIATSPQKAYQTQPDAVSIKLRQQLFRQFTTKFLSELQEKQTFEEIEVLMINLLEEIKNSYVKPSNQTNLQSADTTIPKIIPTEVIELKAGDESNIESG